MHGSLGHLKPNEASTRRELVKASKTPNDIAKLFVDLPELPADTQHAERRVSEQDREEGVDFLREAHAEGRIDEDELAVAEAQVRSARTRSEINAAFRGLSSPTMAAAAKTSSNVAKQTARVVAEGGRRAKRAFLRAVFAVAALMIGIILLIAGDGTVALICFVGAVMLFVSAATTLVASRA
jgi:ABC-type multidrug transport system fused ATPase/permease subunit